MFSSSVYHTSLTTNSPTRFSTFFFFFNDTATTEIYTLSLHDALPILHTLTSSRPPVIWPFPSALKLPARVKKLLNPEQSSVRSEEHTSELQSPDHLVCRLLLEKKKNNSQSRVDEFDDIRVYVAHDLQS